MEKLLKSRTIEECVRDAWLEVIQLRYVPFARSLVILRRLVLQYWRDLYNITPFEKMFLIMFGALFTLFLTLLVR